MNRPELIAPAGDLNKLKIAFMYGADAVYCSTPRFSMRTREIGFDLDSLKEGIEYAHSLGKKVYLTVNVFPHSSEIEDLKEHVQNVIALKPDGIISADLGVISYIKSQTDIPIHVSTQANTVNHLTAQFYQDMGMQRIVVARELSLKDIAIITKETSIDIEAFVHGSMCMAYSGRCQISNYMLGRDPNKGECAQPCRFKYQFYGVKEDMREDIYPVYEDDAGSYIFNSKDLCMIGHIDDMIESGISSFKIEGRLKSEYYLAGVIGAYRKAIDLCLENQEEYRKQIPEFESQVSKLANRGFTTGFFYQKPNQETNNYLSSKATATWGYIGLIEEYNSEFKVATVMVKNRLRKGSSLEILTPDGIYEYELNSIKLDGQEVDEVHANSRIEVPCEISVQSNCFMRLKLN